MTAIVLHSGCATTSHIKKLPSEKINRPHTLPEEISNWQLQGASEWVGEPAPSIYPLYWETAVHSRFTLIFSPFPVDARFQFFHSSVHTLGLDFSLVGTDRRKKEDFIWRPTLQITYRRRVAHRLELALSLRFRPEVRPKSPQDKFPWTLGHRLTITYQLNQRLAVSLFNEWLIEKGNPSGEFDSSSLSRAPGKLGFHFPLGLMAAWFVHARWEIESRYRLISLGLPREFQSHQGEVNLIYYW